MAITFAHEPNQLIQSLLGFGAGYGSGSRQNELIEQQRQIEAQQALAASIGSAGSNIAQGIIAGQNRRDRFRLEDIRQEHALDRATLEQTGLTYGELQQFAQQSGVPVPEAINELRARRLKKEYETKIEADMRQNGYMRGWRQDQIERRNELNREMDIVFNDQGLTGAERLSQMNDIASELSDIKPGWVPDPSFPPPPPPDEIFKASTLTDESGRIFSIGQRNGATDIRMVYDPTDAMKAQATVQQKVIDAAMKAAIFQTEESPTPTFNAELFRDAYNAAAGPLGLERIEDANIARATGQPLKTGNVEQARTQIIDAAVAGDPAAVSATIRGLSTMPPDQAKTTAKAIRVRLETTYTAANPPPPEILPLLKAVKAITE